MRRNLSRRDATYLGFSLLIFIFIAITFVNLFVYPLRASNPNFSDVERVFSRLEFPGEWKEIDSSENSGWRGRVCPIESDGCFNKTINHEVPISTNSEGVKRALGSTGCSVVTSQDYQVISGDPYTTYRCVVDAINVSATLEKPEGKPWTLSTIISTN